MGGELCRYDYVVQAVEALQVYVETCASEANTLRLVKNAKAAVEALEEIEKQNRSYLKGDPGKAVISKAIEAFDRKYSSLQGYVEEMAQYMEKNRQALNGAKRLAAMARSIEEHHSVMNKLFKDIGRRAEAVRQKNDIGG